jgi:hypothetical protein
VTGRYDRDAILAATDLRTLATELLGPHAGTDRHPTWPCPDPNHAQTGATPPVTLYATPRGEERWHCHGCGAGGTAIDLVIAACRIDIRGALERLVTQPPGPTRSGWPSPSRPASVADPDGLRRYVGACARRLWLPAGTTVREWLTSERRLDPEVLRHNQIGADPGPAIQPRPDGMPRGAGAVLPVITGSVSVYAQLRVLHPRCEQPRYLNPAARLAPNPRVARIRPVDRAGDEIVVTEGIIDALTAASGGYRSAAVLGAALTTPATAAALARLPGPLVLALDPDDAGQRATTALTELLHAQHRPPRLLPDGAGDLNERAITSRDWPAQLTELVAASMPTSRDSSRHLGRGVA